MVVTLHNLTIIMPLPVIVLKLMLKYLFPVINQRFAFDLFGVVSRIIKVRNSDAIIIVPAVLNNYYVLSFGKTP